MYHVSANHTYEISRNSYVPLWTCPGSTLFFSAGNLRSPYRTNVRSSSNFWIQFEALKSSHTSEISTVKRENEGV